MQVPTLGKELSSLMGSCPVCPSLGCCRALDVLSIPDPTKCRLLGAHWDPTSPQPSQAPWACTSTLCPASSSLPSGCSSFGTGQAGAGVAGPSCRSCCPRWKRAMALPSFCRLARITWLLRSRLEALISKMVCRGHREPRLLAPRSAPHQQGEPPRNPTWHLHHCGRRAPHD